MRRRETCATCGAPLAGREQFAYCSVACYRAARRNKPYNIARMARLLDMPQSTLRLAIATGRFVWSNDGMRGTLRRGRRPQRQSAHVCPCCGRAFTGIAKRVYCTARCARHTQYERSKGRLSTPRCRCGVACDLLPVPADLQAGRGSWVCRYCVDEGLRRAA